MYNVAPVYQYWYSVVTSGGTSMLIPCLRLMALELPLTLQARFETSCRMVFLHLCVALC